MVRTSASLATGCAWTASLGDVLCQYFRGIVSGKVVIFVIGEE